MILESYDRVVLNIHTGKFNLVRGLLQNYSIDKGSGGVKMRQKIATPHLANCPPCDVVSLCILLTKQGFLCHSSLLVQSNFSNIITEIFQLLMGKSM